MRLRLSLVGLLTLAVAIAPTPAHAAKLVGGREQSRIARAFFAGPRHQGQAIVSIRRSTVAPAWAIVRSVAPRRPGHRSTVGRVPALQSSYYHLVGDRVKPGTPPTGARADSSYALAAPSDGLLSFPATGGMDIGVPATTNPSGDCGPSDYTLGPSLWDSGATTVVTAGLGLLGASLPADPYAPVRVSWPTDSVALGSGFPSSPCQGDGAACHDTFRWTGQVALQAAS